MKILSIIALATAFSYGVIIFRRMRAQMDQENLFSVLVCVCLGWWSFCDALFYSAQIKESAWMWHQLGAFGWCGFIAVTAWYFLAMGGVTKKMHTLVKILYWGFGIGLTLRFVMLRPTAMAENLVQSSSGLGWTFVQNYNTVWPFIFLLYLIVYLGGALGYIFFWQKKVEKDSVRHMARGFVVLDIVSVVTGFISIFIIPYFTSYLPPMGCIALLIFLWGYSIELWEYDLSHIELVLDPQLILDSSLEPMMVTDANYHILYCNQAMKGMFHREELRNTVVLDLLPAKERKMFLDQGNHVDGLLHNVPINLPNGETALMTVNQVYTRRHSQLFYIISMRDISQIRQTQIQMEHMAYYDELTGLANRRRLGELLDVWEKNFRIDQRDFVLVFLDLNDFKRINDRYGHDAGDQALIAVSNVLKNIIEAKDETFRLSGDEFVVLHQMDASEEIQDFVDRVREALSDVDSSKFAPDIRMNASIGTCLYSEYNSVRQMMKIADERMYQMKQEYHRVR